MDSASRVSLEANLARNASRGASRVSLNNKLRVEYSYASGTKKINSLELKMSRNFARQIVDRENVPRFFEGLAFFVQFYVSCTVKQKNVN